jgi:hypothetical protein
MSETTEVPQTPYPNCDVIVHNAAHDLQKLLESAKESMTRNDFLVYCTAIGGIMSMLSQELIALVVSILNKETNETITVSPEPVQRLLDFIKKHDEPAN